MPQRCPVAEPDVCSVIVAFAKVRNNIIHVKFWKLSSIFVAYIFVFNWQRESTAVYSRNPFDYYKKTLY